MGELLMQAAYLGASLPRLLRLLCVAPGLRAIRMPRFGRDAWRNLFLAFGFALLCRHKGELAPIVAWGGFLSAVFLYLSGGIWHFFNYLSKAKAHGGTPQPLYVRFCRMVLPKVIAQLPNIMLFVWAGIQLGGHPSVWLVRVCGLVWLNYFAVGCAVALRRGVDDLVRSRKRTAY